MQIVNVLQTGKDYKFKWPSGDVENYTNWIDYSAVTEDGKTQG